MVGSVTGLPVLNANGESGFCITLRFIPSSVGAAATLPTPPSTSLGIKAMIVDIEWFREQEHALLRRLPFKHEGKL